MGGNRGRGEKGRGGVGDFPLTFSNTQTHARTHTHRAASPGCSHGKIPVQPQKAALLGRREVTWAQQPISRKRLDSNSGWSGKGQRGNPGQAGRQAGRSFPSLI